MFRSWNDATALVPIDRSNSKKSVSKLYKCEYCSHDGWTSETEAEIHRTTVHAQILTNLLKNPYTCKTCIRECGTLNDLQKHIRIEHLYSSEDAFRVEREIYVCNKCHEIFFNKSLLSIHLKYTHTKSSKKRYIKCIVCSKTIKLDNIWLHLQSHDIHSVSTCKICLMKCSSTINLKDHIKTHRKHLICDICMFLTNKEDLFKQHIKNKYKQIKNITGWEVKDDFERFFIPEHKKKLKFQKYKELRGLRLANGTKICVFCREICDNEQDMKDHIIIEHFIKESTVNTQYYCTCGEIFTSRLLLKQHCVKLKDHKFDKSLLIVK